MTFIAHFAVVVLTLIHLHICTSSSLKFSLVGSCERNITNTRRLFSVSHVLPRIQTTAVSLGQYLPPSTVIGSIALMTERGRLCVQSALAGSIAFGGAVMTRDAFLHRSSFNNKLSPRKDSYAVVTGATTGLGQEMSKALYRKGYNIVVVGSSTEQLQFLRSSLLQEKVAVSSGPALPDQHSVWRSRASRSFLAAKLAARMTGDACHTGWEKCQPVLRVAVERCSTKSHQLRDQVTSAVSLSKLWGTGAVATSRLLDKVSARPAVITQQIIPAAPSPIHPVYDAFDSEQLERDEDASQVRSKQQQQQQQPQQQRQQKQQQQELKLFCGGSVAPCDAPLTAPMGENAAASDSPLLPVVTTRDVQLVHCDLSDPMAPLHIMRELRKAKIDDKIDILAHCDGRESTGPTVLTPLSDASDLIEVNVKATVLLTRLLLPRMMRRAAQVSDKGAPLSGGSRIAFLSSAAAAAPGVNRAVLTASQAFISSFAQSLHRELLPHGIGVTVAHLGAVASSSATSSSDSQRLPTLIGALPGGTLSAEETASRVVDAVQSGRPCVTPGLANKAYMQIGRWFPPVVSGAVGQVAWSPAPRWLCRLQGSAHKVVAFFSGAEESGMRRAVRACAARLAETRGLVHSQMHSLSEAVRSTAQSLYPVINPFAAAADMWHSARAELQSSGWDSDGDFLDSALDTAADDEVAADAVEDTVDASVPSSEAEAAVDSQANSVPSRSGESVVVMNGGDAAEDAAPVSNNITGNILSSGSGNTSGSVGSIPSTSPRRRRMREEFDLLDLALEEQE